ncbi:MAG: ComEC/Rec2 family competence protein [Ginsengibacter sp.]
MSAISIPLWKKAPFLRLVLPLILGILLQWYMQFEWIQILPAGIGFIIAFLLFQLLPLALRFKLQAFQGLLVNLIILVFGVLLTYQKDVRHQQNWFGNFYDKNDYLAVTINEPPLEKSKSYKADALVENVITNDTVNSVSGKVVLYFIKDSTVAPLKYGDRILFNKKLQSIQNSGNPGAFNYKRYLAFKQIFHTVFLKKGEWIVLPEKNINQFKQFLFTSRQKILDVLNKNMQGNDDQLSIAEALLIGYTQDLDKDLVQAYSNTGVVHIIAISGMHLGLIYVMLVWIFKRVPYIKKLRILRVILILSSLWLFALLTGGGASILRSAVMFSCIVMGDIFKKKPSIYNSLAASAFILLCVNPFYLWDVGFQLSYLALLGIVILQKPIYHLLFVKNWLLNKIWQLTAVSLAAQIFTFPVCLYYFHQFPTIFLFTNLLTVPLSTIILFVEIFLIAFAWIPLLAFWIGKLTWWLIWIMNKIILFFNDLPYALWDRIPATLTSTLLLYAIVCGIIFWLLNKSKTALTISLFLLFTFTFLNAFNKWNIVRQQKVIVYNVPQHQAIDFVRGNSYKFIGDSILFIDGMLQNFHIKPGRIALQLHESDSNLAGLSLQGNYFYNFLSRSFFLLDTSIAFQPGLKKINVDVIIISKNPKVYIPQLALVFNCSKYVFDASNSLWKIDQWKKDCEKLHLPFHSVPDQGAFIMDL